MVLKRSSGCFALLELHMGEAIGSHFSLLPVLDPTLYCQKRRGELEKGYEACPTDPTTSGNSPGSNAGTPRGSHEKISPAPGVRRADAPSAAYLLPAGRRGASLLLPLREPPPRLRQGATCF